MPTATRTGLIIKVKRVYEASSRSDGYRVLVDRLWPRGVTKAAAKIDLWLKDLGPSDALRKWFGHDPAKWGQFKKRYCAELAKKGELIEQLRASAKNRILTLVFGAKDEQHNQAVALREFLEKLHGDD